MNKFELKNLIYKACDKIENIEGELFKDGCDTDETGELRSKAHSALLKAFEELKSIAYNIY